MNNIIITRQDVAIFRISEKIYQSMVKHLNRIYSTDWFVNLYCNLWSNDKKQCLHLKLILLKHVLGQRYYIVSLIEKEFLLVSLYVTKTERLLVWEVATQYGGKSCRLKGQSNPNANICAVVQYEKHTFCHDIEIPQ